MEYVFDWCTDYGAKDAALEGDKYERRVISRTPRQVVYEDLQEEKDGWFWSRHVVRLDPPRHWHSDSIGSHRAYSLEYRLTSPADGETELVLTAQRRPYGRGEPNPRKAEWERSVLKSWKRFAKALESDYNRSRASVGKPR